MLAWFFQYQTSSGKAIQCFTPLSLASYYEISTFQVAEHFGVKEICFAMGVLHGTGSNREEITRFAVKRLNVPLLATVTVMPHTHTVYPRFPVSTCNHTHTWHNDMMISHLFTITNLLELHSILCFLFTIFGLKHFPKFYLIGGREFRRLHQAVLIFINLLHIWQTGNVFLLTNVEHPRKANEMYGRIFLSKS